MASLIVPAEDLQETLSFLEEEGEETSDEEEESDAEGDEQQLSGQKRVRE